MAYKPPKVSKYPDYERGYHVQCPASCERKLPTKGGKLVIKKDDPMAPRSLCATHARGEACDLCPNGEFKMVVKNIGPGSDYAWLDDVLDLVCKAMDAKITKRKRTFGDCCIDHRDVILVEIYFEMDTSATMDRKAGKLVYDMIMKASRGNDVRHEVLHVKLRRHPTPSFDITVALRRY